MHGSHNLKLLIKSVEDDEIGTIISNKKCDTRFPIVSCTKKHSENDMEQLTFLHSLNEEEKYEALNEIIENSNHIVFFGD